ncbi:uncharacterized protein F54H12.2 [Trichonephila clavata]|uniref:Uncharacterized protein F54H12.2 n=1 Tax=Trichonephila clavata TaxID=2740835 RepID=A0A8X6K721_TRICU|nr:uncharacterized protein F54H12.2 [Trichonephila clavata]
MHKIQSGSGIKERNPTKKIIRIVSSEIERDEKKQTYSRSNMDSRACACVKSELDLFNVNPVQLSTEDSSFTEIFPVASLSDKTPIEFYVSGSGEHYLDLAHTLLHLQVKIKKRNGTILGAPDQVAPINYLLNTLFSECSVL